MDTHGRNKETYKKEKHYEDEDKGYQRRGGGGGNECKQEMKKGRKKTLEV